MIFPRLVFCAVAIAAVFLSSCATSRVEYIDATIAPAIAQPGTVVVAGLIGHNIQPPGDSERRAILNRLESKLDQRRKNKLVMGHDTFERQVGRLRSTGSGYSGSLSYVLSSAQVEKAKHLGADFALVVAMVENQTWCDVDESCVEHEEPIYDKCGNVVDCRHWTEYTTTSYARRFVSADYLLYDLSTGKKVWACSTKYEESNGRSRCSDICYPPPPPHPAPPTVADVMDNLSNAAIRKFPR